MRANSFDIFISSFHAKIKLLRLGRAEESLLMSRRFVREKRNRNLGCGWGWENFLKRERRIQIHSPLDLKHHPESLLLMASFQNSVNSPIWRSLIHWSCFLVHNLLLNWKISIHSTAPGRSYWQMRRENRWKKLVCQNNEFSTDLNSAEMFSTSIWIQKLKLFCVLVASNEFTVETFPIARPNSPDANCAGVVSYHLCI